VREHRRIKTSFAMAGLATLKVLAGFGTPI
jgi:hypothetical protein